MRIGTDGTSTTTGPTGTQTSSFDVSTSEGVVQVGVGLDIKVSTRMSLRLGGDYIRVLTEGDDHVWLATAGLSFGLGTR